MASADRPRMSEGERSERYLKAVARFASVSGWRAYVELADEFRALDSYRDARQMYDRCIKAASAPAYRETTERLAQDGSATSADYREGARVMRLIQGYADARELLRVYEVRANALDYDEAMALLTRHGATNEELGRGVELLRTVRGFRDSREQLERYEKFYGESVYAAGLALMRRGRVFSEFDEAAELFERIPFYSDAAEQAAACRKQANRLRPKARRKRSTAPPAEPRPEGAAPADETSRARRGGARGADAEAGDAGTGDAGTGKRAGSARRKRSDEVSNTVSEVWRAMDKRYLARCVAWFLALVADVWLSVFVPSLRTDWVKARADILRMCFLIAAVVLGVLLVRDFLRMLTASMRERLARAAIAFLRRVTKPLVEAFNRLLLSIGIDLSRRNRLRGRDEREFVFAGDREKKQRKRLKNELKWAEQPDNAARVRFIFIEYMIRRIRKGYLMRGCMTPREIGAEIAFEEDERELFRVYDLARYAGRAANEEITAQKVGELRAINQRKG